MGKRPGGPGGTGLTILNRERLAPDFHALFDAAPGACLVLDTDLRIIAVNAAYLAATMTEREALLGRDLFDVIPGDPDEPEADGSLDLRASLERVLELRRPDAMPIRKYGIRRSASAGGGFEERHWRARNCPVLDATGAVSAVIHHVEDVTELVRLRAQEAGREDALRELNRVVARLGTATRDLADQQDQNALLESERLNLASIVAHSEDAIITKMLDGRVTSWNAAAERLFGYTEAEMIGRPVACLFPPELLAEEDEIIARLRAGERIAHYETRRRRKDGSEVAVSLSISPIRDADGTIVGASKIVRDVSDRKEAEERLAELQAELIHMSRWNTVGIMASAITHDLNQPLGASANYLAALRRVLNGPTPNPKLAGEIVDKAAQQTLRAGQIVQQLRNFVSKGEPERKPQDLAEVAAEALELAAFAFKQHKVEAMLDAQSGLPRAAIDRVQMQQVFVNLLRNAAEAMAASPERRITVRIAMDPAAAALMAEVADTGPGLPEEISARLFQPFATTKSSGMGLGLSICQQIVRAHGGRLAARPNTPRGTVFAMWLPLRGADTEAA